MSEYSDWLAKCHKVVLDGTPLPDDDVEELLFLLDTFAPAVAWCQERFGATFRPDSWPGSGHGFSWHNRGAEFYFAESRDAVEFMCRWGGGILFAEEEADGEIRGPARWAPN